jgi:hypothetical protein
VVESVQIIVLTPPCSPRITLGPGFREDLQASAEDTAGTLLGEGIVLGGSAEGR